MGASTVTREQIDAEQARFEEEAGEAVGPMPQSPPDNTVIPEELRVDGTTQLGLFKAGGKAPTGATLRLQGGAIELVDGQAYSKGDVISFSGTARVVEVGQRDKEDRQTAIVVSCTQKHVAVITDLQVRKPS